jgi:thymidylate kinase
MVDDYLTRGRVWPILIAIEGPSGCGKSTLLHGLEKLLAGDQLSFRTASNNDSGEWSTLIRSLALNPHAALALALATAGARAELRETAHGPILCDRYVLSTFVYQRFAGVLPDYLYAVNSPLLERSVTFALTITPALLADRRGQRQSTRRDWFKENLDLRTEIQFYEEAIEDLVRRGHDIRRVDASDEVDTVASRLASEVASLLRAEVPG